MSKVDDDIPFFYYSLVHPFHSWEGERMQNQRECDRVRMATFWWVRPHCRANMWVQGVEWRDNTFPSYLDGFMD